MITNEDFPYMYFTNVNRRVNPYTMKDEELWDSVNWWTERVNGALKVRPGYKKIFDTVDANPVKGLFYEKFPAGTKRLIRLSGHKIYAIDPTSATVWGTAKLTATGTDNWSRPEYTVLTGLVMIVDRLTSTNFKYVEGNASDTYTERTTVAGTDPIVPYTAQTVTTYHRRVYVGDTYDGTNEFASMISWSSIDYANKGSSPASPWTTQATLNDITFASNRHIDRDYHGNIIKLTNINDRLNIYKEEGIYRYNESSVFNLFNLSPIQGSIATMFETNEDFFFTNEGFFRTDGQSVKPVGEGWYPIIKQVMQNGITPSSIVSGAYNFLYFCYMGNIKYDGRTVTNACWVYNIYTDQLSLWSMAHNITCFGYYVDSSKEKQIVFGDANGNVYQLDYTANDDAGVTIEASFRSKYYFYDNPIHQNQIAQCAAFCNPGSEMQILIDKDFKNEYDAFMDVAGLDSQTKVNLNTYGQFKLTSFKGIWNGKGNRPEFYGIVPKIIDVEERLREGKRK